LLGTNYWPTDKSGSALSGHL